jgi:hypothetical protein
MMVVAVNAMARKARHAALAASAALSTLTLCAMALAVTLVCAPPLKRLSER